MSGRLVRPADAVDFYLDDIRAGGSRRLRERVQALERFEGVEGFEYEEELVDPTDVIPGPGWQTSEFKDEFYNLRAWGSAGPGIVTSGPGITGHPGIQNIQTGATSGNIERIYLAENASEAPLLAQDFVMEWVVNPAQITTVAYRVGVSNAWADNPPAAWLGVEFNTTQGDTTWHYIARNASTETDTDSGVTVVADDWYTFRVRVIGSTAAVFSINGGAETTITTNLPTAYAPGAQVRTASAASRWLGVDFFSLLVTSMDRSL